MVNYFVPFALGLISSALASACGFPIPDFRGIGIMAMTLSAYILGRIIK